MSPTWSTTSTTQRLIQRSSRMNPPSYSFDMELDDELIRKELSSPLFTQEREEPANLRQTDHSLEESLLPAKSFFRTHKYGKTRVRTKFKFVSKTEIKSRPQKTNKCGFSLEDAKSKFLLKPDLRSSSTNFKPILTEEVFRNYLELLILSDWKLIILLHGVSNPGKINYHPKKKDQNKIGIPVKLVSGICETWKNCIKVTCSRSRNFQEEKLTENFEEVTYSSRARMSRQSTSLATMTPSTHMLRLTTSTPGNRWLQHCTFRSEKHVRACCRFVTRKRESLFQGAKSINFSKYRKPVNWMSQKRKSNQELDNSQFRITLEREEEHLLAEEKT